MNENTLDDLDLSNESSRNVNIAASGKNGDIADTSYRYKMPSVKVKHEGKGNGVKTIFSNLSKIAESLNRKEDEILQYIASELSVAHMEKNGNLTVMGTFSAEVAQCILQKFVESHVLCGECGNPETNLTLQKGDLYKRCDACGGKTLVSNHKLNKKITTRLSLEKKLKKDKKSS